MCACGTDKWCGTWLTCVVNNGNNSKVVRLVYALVSIMMHGGSTYWFV